MFQPAYPRSDSFEGVLPVYERVGAPHEWTGRGVSIAFIDSGYYPHPDFSRRVRVHVRAAWPTVTESLQYKVVRPESWHGTMTTAIAAGSGRQSGGKYAGIAPRAGLVLVSVVNPRGGLREPDILRGLRWVRDHGAHFGVRVVNLSVGGDKPSLDNRHPLHDMVRELVAQGVVVVAAAGNGGRGVLVPPATSADAITVGGMDDGNQRDPDQWRLYAHSWGSGTAGSLKPDILAPATWVASPYLPGTAQARAAGKLANLLSAQQRDPDSVFELLRRMRHDQDLNLPNDNGHVAFAAVEAALARFKVVNAHYQYADGTSVAAAIVSGVVAQVFEANPALTPANVRDVLQATARPLVGVPTERQGAGVVQAGLAVAEALQRRRRGRG